jgi:hypothetical protein
MLADRVKSTPPQQKDLEAEQLLRQLAQERPDTVYILAQTVLMQDFALRNAQAQIEDLQRQLSQQPPRPESGSGSFLGGLFGGSGAAPQRQPAGSVPRVNPWGSAPQGRPSGDYPPPPPPSAGYPDYGPGGPVMQPSQTGGFLRNAATTAAGVAGGALLFQGINSLFSGHHGSLLGGGLSGITPNDSLTGKTVVNNDGTPASDKEHLIASHDADQGGHHGDASDASYDQGDDYDDDGDFGGDDYA